MTHNVPIQSLIDHIKTAIDVDPWAKEMVEELLKEQPEIVKCRDCVKRKTEKCLLYWNEIMDDENWNDDWFCADGDCSEKAR